MAANQKSIGHGHLGQRYSRCRAPLPRGVETEHGIVVIPTLYVRDGDSLILQGSTGAGMARAVRGGKPLTVEVTHLDGIVAARSHFP